MEDKNQVKFSDMKEYIVKVNIYLKNNKSEELKFLVDAKNASEAEEFIFEKFKKALTNNDGFIYGWCNGVRKSEIATFDIYDNENEEK